MMQGVYNRLGLHVSASPRQVIRAARKVIARHRLGHRHRDTRAEFYLRMLENHMAAQSLYYEVVRARPPLPGAAIRQARRDVATKGR
jgi:hypothetical protein